MDKLGFKLGSVWFHSFCSFYHVAFIRHISLKIPMNDRSGSCFRDHRIWHTIYWNFLVSKCKAWCWHSMDLWSNCNNLVEVGLNRKGTSLACINVKVLLGMAEPKDSGCIISIHFLHLWALLSFVLTLFLKLACDICNSSRLTLSLLWVVLREEFSLQS